ncbi:MAG: hypothetical protein H6510_17260 [Acidobacteria bacterium]|nr:hypothetical protein [Acidobacteriota bacterium]
MKPISLSIFFLLLFVGCGPKQVQHAPLLPANDHLPALVHSLDASVYVQSSQEYTALCRQTYRNAERVLDDLLANAEHTALPTQNPDSARALPAAIILDLDETVLDNGGFQNQLLNENVTYTRANWNRWVDKMQAGLVPGALAFLQLAEQKGVALFYISNRYPETFETTKQNLIQLGIPYAGDEHLLLRGEHSDKTERRNGVAAQYRIVMMLGDSLGDFDARFDATDPVQRNAALADYDQHFGRDWFVLPNPVYGTWLRSLDSLADQPQESLTDKKIRWLEASHQ